MNDSNNFSAFSEIHQNISDTYQMRLEELRLQMNSVTLSDQEKTRIIKSIMQIEQLLGIPVI